MNQGNAWNPSGQAPQPGFGQPAFGAPPGAPPVMAAPVKKSRGKGLIIAGCLGCLGLLLSICVCGGWIGYLEEGRSYSDPGDELASVPISSGAPISLEATWNGTGYADMRVYVDLGSSAPAGARVTGTFGCQSYGDIRMESVDETYYGSSSGQPPEGWVQIPPRYNYRRASAAPFRCEGTLTLPPGTGSARLVITRRPQRPSDWSSEWF